MPAQIILKARGLSTSPNSLETSEGSLTVAKNIIIRRNNVIESRRGFKLYGSIASGLVKQLIVYKERILRHVGTSLQYDTEVLNTNNESVFDSFNGTFNETQTGLRIKSIESNGNLYFTTSTGIKKISASSPSQFTTSAGYVTNAGGVKAINGSARIDLELGNTAGFLPEDSAVAYRIVWGIKDANNNLILGTPSDRIVVYNELMDLLIPDYMRVLGALDDITTTSTTAFIGDGDYVSSLGLQNDSSPNDLQTSLINLATKIDEDIFIAGSASQPIVIEGGTSDVTVASNVVTLTKDSGGNFNDYFIPGSKIVLQGFSGSAAVLNGSHTVVTASATQITFNFTTANFTQTPILAGSEIVSGEYRYAIANVPFGITNIDLNTFTVSDPATNNQLKTLQAAILEIISRLQDENTFVITAPNLTEYITPLDVTTTTNVIVNVNIPEAITSNYFVQLYRSDISQATGTTVLSDLTPNDEMKLVYESFPTSAELTAKEMIIEDIVADVFRGANLYTNPASGEGITNANDIPPIAKDVNRFKNVLFYANTQTRHRVNLNLLGVQNFKAGEISNITAGINSVVTSNNHGLSVNDIVYVNGTDVVAYDKKLFRVTAVTTNTFTIDTPSGSSSTVGYWTNSMINISSESGSNNYYFIKEQPEITDITTLAGAGLAGLYFTINSGLDETEYYVWYRESGTGVDPAISGKIGIVVNVLTGDTAAQVAIKTRDTLNRYPADFIASSSSNIVTVTNVQKGITTDATPGTSGFTISITQKGHGQNADDNEVLLSDAISPSQAVDETARSLQTVVNTKSNESIYIYYLSGLADVPGKMLFEGRNLSSSKFYVIANNFAVGDSFDPPITPNPTDTITNTVANPTVITASSHGLVSGDDVIIGFSNSSPSINGVQLVTFISTNTFSVPVNVTTAGSTGSIIKSTSAISSDNETKQNRIYYSKLQQPEAVPILNYFDIGSEEKAILRIFPLRDSLFVFKEDGLFRISGESAPFNLALFDSSCILIAPDSLGVSNNLIYGWTTQGIHTVSEAGIDIVSREIDIDLLQRASVNYPNFGTVTWGVGYDSDNSYTVYTNNLTTDTVATIGYRFSNLTNSWTTIDKTNTCGLINDKDDRMYMGAGDVNYLEQERKTFTRTDYADREIVTTISSGSVFSNGQRIKLASVVDIAEGDVLFQEQYVTLYNYNTLLKKIDIDNGIARIPITGISLGSTPTITLKNFTFSSSDINLGTDTFTIAAHGYNENQKVRFISTGTLPAPIVAGVDYYITNATTNTFQLANTSDGTIINITAGGSGTHRIYSNLNASVNNYIKLSNTNSDPVLDGTYQIASIVNEYQFTINTTSAVTTTGTSGFSQFLYYDNLQMVAGDDPKLKLLALSAKLDTDPGTQLANYTVNISDKSGTIVSNSSGSTTTISLKNTNFVPADVNTGTDVITIASHGFTNGQPVTFVSSTTLPGGITANTEYFIANATLNTFQLSLSSSNVIAIDLTTQGVGTHTIRLSHQLNSGRRITITGSNSVPSIDNSYTISVSTSPYQFTIPVNITIPGTSGSYVTQNTNVLDIQACYNAIISKLNIDAGAIFNNYTSISSSTPLEALITSVNTFTQEVAVSPALNFLVGPITVFKAIDCELVYQPQTMQDALGWKHLTNFTMMFENKAFTEAVVSFSSDLLPEFIEVPFNGDGNGIFGHTVNFGSGFFGGGSHGAPFRTYFPRQVMRCRYLNIKFNHMVAREQWAIFGITIDGNISLSSRAYR